MTKKELAALEKVFSTEIGGRLPFQSRAKIYEKLLEDGMVERVTAIIGGGWPEVTVRGYALTLRGHIAYCESCRDAEEP